MCDKRNAAKAGRSLEIVGFFNPLTKERNVKADRVKYWISVGAQPSDRAHNLFVQEGVIKADKIAVHAKPKKKEGEKTEVVKDETKPTVETKPAEKKEEKPAETKQEEKKEESKSVEVKKESEPTEEVKSVDDKKEKVKKDEPKQEEKIGRAHV